MMMTTLEKNREILKIISNKKGNVTLYHGPSINNELLTIIYHHHYVG